DELNADSIAAQKGSAVHYALEYYVKEGLKIDIALEKLIAYYAGTELWKLDDRKPGKGWKHPVEKDCANCEWASKNKTGFFCKIAKKDTSELDGCPGPNFDDDWIYTQIAINRNKDVYARKLIGTEV